MEETFIIKNIDMFVDIDGNHYRFTLPESCIYMSPFSMNKDIIQHDKYFFYTKEYYENKYEKLWTELQLIPKDLLIKIIDESYFSTN